MGAGRPKIYVTEDLTQDLIIYTENEDNPTVAKFCLHRGICRETLYRHAKESNKLANTIKMLHLKQEARTIDLMEAGELAPAWAIFKMKQKCYGWTDKQEIESINKNINVEATEEEAVAILKAAGIDPNKL